MTSDQQDQFEAEWPALALRLQAMLRRKRLSDWLVEDLVQETGCRLIRMWNEIDRAKPVWPLVATIALNLLRDEMRKGTWSELTGAVPDAASGENVETRGLARLELREVGGALSQLNDSQRSVLLASVTDTPSEGADPSALRMLRMRARKRLHQLMDQASVLGVTVGMQLRRVMREAEIFISKALPVDAERIPAAALSIVAALSLGLVTMPDESVASPERAGRPDDAISHEASSDGYGVGTSAGSEANARTTRKGARLAERSTKRARNSNDDRGARRGSGDDGGGTVSGTQYHIPISDGTYVKGSTTVELEGFDDESRDSSTGWGTGSLSCSTSPSNGAGASCTHGGDGWSQRSARVKQHNEVWVEGERVL